MTTRRRALVLLIAMAWQALAWLTPAHLDRQAEQIAHLVVHAQEVDHHHHADQTLHVEEDGSEPPHQHASQAAQLPGLAPAMSLAAGEPIPPVMVPSAGASHAPIYLEGLLRPPRRGAEHA
ncbi:MAG: hypothetical protein EON92_08320 [Burkholderiales bacterium]|nr:MAG: hypothetical protein EON92_08320 [Burkholderiales bacterium]